MTDGAFGNPWSDRVFGQQLRLSHWAELSIILQHRIGHRGNVLPPTMCSTAKQNGCTFRERVLEYSIPFRQFPGALNEEDCLCICDGAGELEPRSRHTLRAQESGTIQIKDPAEFNAYQMATTQTDPKAKAAALESFLTDLPAKRSQEGRARHAGGHLSAAAAIRTRR